MQDGPLCRRRLRHQLQYPYHRDTRLPPLEQLIHHSTSRFPSQPIQPPTWKSLGVSPTTLVPY